MGKSSQVTSHLTWVIIYNQVTSQVQKCINIHLFYALQFWFLICNIWKNRSHKNSKHFHRGNSPETGKPNLFLTWIKSSQVASQVTRDLTWKIFWREVTWLDSTWKFFQLCMTWLGLFKQWIRLDLSQKTTDLPMSGCKEKLAEILIYFLSEIMQSKLHLYSKSN
jgi:hypothetical protein